MAISLKTAGSWARMVTDNGTVAIPGSPAAGDRMFLFGTWKTFSVTVADPSGWTQIGTVFADGAVAAGNGTGSVAVHTWYRDWQSGDAAPAIDYSAAPTEGHWVIMLWQKAGGDIWGSPLTVTAGITAVDPFSATSSATVDVPDASVVMCLIGLRDDSTTIARTTTSIGDDGSPTVTWNGNYVESPATHFNSTTGFDMSGDLGHRLVTTGANGVNLTIEGDPAAAETGSAKWVIQGLAVSPTGTGAISVPSATVDGTGVEEFTATGAVTVPAATTAGSGAEVFTATGAVIVPAPTVVGVGDHGAAAPPSGTGAISVPAATMAGVGELSFTATGAVVASAATVSGEGIEVLTATGAIVIPAATVSGAGLHAEDATGTGAIVVPAATVSGVGSGGVVESDARLLRLLVPKEQQIFAFVELEGPLATIKLRVKVAGPFQARAAVEAPSASIALVSHVTELRLLQQRSLEDAQILGALVDNGAYHPLLDE
jgi:hypothetical protein